MPIESRDLGDGAERPVPAGYESPRVDQVLTLAELEREILYAGPVATQDLPG